MRKVVWGSRAPAAALSQVSPQYGSQRDVMTLLAPPPFPTQFDSSDPVSETDRSTSEDWKIKTDRERYIDALGSYFLAACSGAMQRSYVPNLQSANWRRPNH